MLAAAAKAVRGAVGGGDDAAAAYEAAIRDAGGIGLERVCKNCGFKNDSGVSRDACQQCGKPLPMSTFMRADERALYEGLLVELAMQGQVYAKHVWPQWESTCGKWASYEPNPCLLNGCPCATKFLKGAAELFKGRIDPAGPKTQLRPCKCGGKGQEGHPRGYHGGLGCDDCLGTGQAVEASWGRLGARWCFHGTRSNDVYCLIAHDSLRPDLRAGQACGPGEYFGVNPQVSLGYAAGTGRQLICFCFTGDCPTAQQQSGGQRCHSSGAPHWSHNPGFCYVQNNPGGRGSVGGREGDRGILYCVPVGIVSYGDAQPLNWSKLSCGAAILGARSTWDLPAFSLKLETARRAQVSIQREEQLMWAYIHFDAGLRESCLMHHFRELWQEWPRSRDRAAQAEWRLAEREKQGWAELTQTPEATQMRRVLERARAAEEQKKRQVLEKRLGVQLKGLLKLVAKTLDGHTMLRTVGVSPDRFTHWVVSFLPPSGSPFQDYPLNAVMEFPLTWPADPPVLRFHQKLFHPNVDAHCLLHLPLQRPGAWEAAFGKAPKPHACFSRVVEEVCALLVRPDMLHTADGSIAGDYDPDGDAYRRWWHDAAEHHGQDTDGFGRVDSGEEYAAAPAGRDAGAAPAGGGEAKRARAAAAPAPPTYAEFAAELDAARDGLDARIAGRADGLLGDRTAAGCDAERAALGARIEEHRAEFARHAAAVSDEYRGEFLRRLAQEKRAARWVPADPPAAP